MFSIKFSLILGSEGGSRERPYITMVLLFYACMNLAVPPPGVKLGLLCFFLLYITKGHAQHKGKVLLLMQDQDFPLPLTVKPF